MVPRCRSGRSPAQPILFASTGEKLEDFDVFHPDRMASRILGMGDVLTLIEQAEQAFDADQKEKMTAKLMGGEQFTLEDFLDQLIAVRRMGPIANVLAMMPGMGQMKDQLAELDDSHFDRVTAIIRSMTPGERTNPKIINGSRRARIANGSGVTVMDVNQLLNRFADAQKMMKQMGGMMGLPGGGRRKATKCRRTSARAPRAAVVRVPGPAPGCRAASRVACRSSRRGWTRTISAGGAGPAARLQAARSSTSTSSARAATRARADACR